MLDSHIHKLKLDMKHSDAQTLVTEGIYIFLGKCWLLTIHSLEVDLAWVVKRTSEEKNRPLLESSVDVLYYRIAFSRQYLDSGGAGDNGSCGTLLS